MFIETAEEQRWIPSTLPRDLIRVIAEYYCTRNHVWDTTSAPDMRHFYYNNIPMKNFIFDDPIEDCPHPVRAVTVGLHCWRRLWGLHSFGSGRVTPHFAVCISRVCSPDAPPPEFAGFMDQRALALGVGVSRKKSPGVEPDQLGVDETDYVVVSSRRPAFNVRYDPSVESTEVQSILAMTAGRTVSRILSTRHIPPAMRPGCAPTEGEGFVILNNPQSVVVGFDCDLTASTMRVFLNDRLLRVTSDLYGQSEKTRADDGLAVGDPFVWRIPNLGDCYPLITTFHCIATIDFVNDWVPPMSSDTGHK